METPMGLTPDKIGRVVKIQAFQRVIARDETDALDPESLRVIAGVLEAYDVTKYEINLKIAGVEQPYLFSRDLYHIEVYEPRDRLYGGRRSTAE